MLTSWLDEANTEAQVAEEEEKLPRWKRLTIDQLRYWGNVEERKAYSKKKTRIWGWTKSKYKEKRVMLGNDCCTFITVQVCYWHYFKLSMTNNSHCFDDRLRSWYSVARYVSDSFETHPTVLTRTKLTPVSRSLHSIRQSDHNDWCFSSQYAILWPIKQVIYMSHSVSVTGIVVWHSDAIEPKMISLVILWQVTLFADSTCAYLREPTHVGHAGRLCRT